MSGPDDLYDLCVEYLAACVAAVGSTVGGPIDRSYVSPGPPVFDCEQLTVHVVSPAEADTAPLGGPLQPMQRAGKQGSVKLVYLVATVLRCTPVFSALDDIPEPAEMQASAREVQADLWAIENVTRSLYRAGTLFPPFPHRWVEWSPALSVQTQGGLAGWQIPVRVNLDGYDAP